MIKKKNYIKIKDLNLEKSDNPKITFENYTIDSFGNLYNGKNIVTNSNKHKEEETAEWLKNNFHIDVKIMPEVTIKGIKSHDYLLDNSNERWECKADINGCGINVLKNNLNYLKATSYVFDISKCVDKDNKLISKGKLSKMINLAFEKRKYLNYLIIKNKNELIGIYKGL